MSCGTKGERAKESCFNPYAVPAGCECPVCGEKDPNRLIWIDDDCETTRCVTCGKIYQPDMEYEYDDDNVENC